MKMKLRHVLATGLCSAALFAAASQTHAASVAVDPSKNWIGYVNVFEQSSAGGGYLWGSPWGVAALPAVFSSSGLILGPNVNTYAPGDAFWVNPDGTGAKQLSANFYVEDSSLGGTTVTFSGDVLANTLVSPYSSVAFVKEFAPGYAFVGQTTAQLVGGSAFSIQHAAAPGNIIQYGFETFGPNANPATVAELGFVQIGVVPEPTSIALLVMGAAMVGFCRRKH
jgi:hypothetical protein